MEFENITLEGTHVRLEPLSRLQKEGLCKAIADGELWNLHVTLVPHISNIDVFIDNALQTFKSQDGLSFVSIDKKKQ